MKNQVLKDTDLGIYIIKCIDVAFQKQDLGSFFLITDNENASQEKDLYLNLRNSKLYNFKLLTKDSIFQEIKENHSIYNNLSKESLKMAERTCEYLTNHKYPPIIRIAPFPDKINSPFRNELNSEKLKINNDTKGLEIPNTIVRTLRDHNSYYRSFYISYSMICIQKKLIKEFLNQ